MITAIGLNIVDIAGGDMNYQFIETENPLEFLENPTCISVLLYNTETNITLDYQLTITTDKSLKKNQY